MLPSCVPSVEPSPSPILSLTSRAPSESPTSFSSNSIVLPSVVPSVTPSLLSPTLSPSRAPSASPTSVPSITPSLERVIKPGFYFQVTFASIVNRCCGLLALGGLVYLCSRCVKYRRTLMRKEVVAQVEPEIAIATTEEGMRANGHDATDEGVREMKCSVYRCDVRPAQIIKYVEMVHDAMVTDAVFLAPTKRNNSANTTMHLRILHPWWE